MQRVIPLNNLTAATTPLILAIFILASTQAQPEAKSKFTAFRDLYSDPFGYNTV